MRIFVEKNEKKSLFFIQKHTNKYHFFPTNKPTYCFFYVSKIQIENLNCWKKITLIQIWHKFWILKFFTFSEQKKLNLNSVVEILFIFLVNLFFSVSEFVRFEKKKSCPKLQETLANNSSQNDYKLQFHFLSKTFCHFCSIVKILLFVFSTPTQKNHLNFVLVNIAKEKIKVMRMRSKNVRCGIPTQLRFFLLLWLYSWDRICNM